MDNIEQYTDIFDNVHNMIKERGYVLDDYDNDPYNDPYNG